jgi:hypothetical protein
MTKRSRGRRCEAYRSGTAPSTGMGGWDRGRETSGEKARRGCCKNAGAQVILGYLTYKIRVGGEATHSTYNI